ncbi:hypothetical protein B7P43_G10886 [Cryptotermes secundus]|uniref:Uncharacterized protein n=1 Tax=Cryptotermes secundus TaxID=105785 RepID=A0A2J7QPG7_9NEOP|nr:hypothetical protein B7P43_G10886 [Cryptotermes secundus]
MNDEDGEANGCGKKKLAEQMRCITHFPIFIVVHIYASMKCRKLIYKITF